MTYAARRKEPETPPPALSNVDAERAVIGKLLVDGRLWYDCADRLTPEHFSDSRHRSIYKAMQTLSARGSPLIRQLIPSVIGDDHKDDIALPAYLAALIAEAPEVSIGEFVDAVLDAARRRHGIQETEWIADQLRGAELGRSAEIISEAQRRLSLVGTDPGDDGSDLADHSRSVMARAQEIRESEKPAGLRTGLTAFDELVGSMLPGQLIVVAGQAGSGKTSLATQIAIMVARKGTPTLMFSLEMQGDELAARVLASFAEISAEKIVESDLNDMELQRVAEADRQLRQIPFHIDDRPRPLTSTLLSRAARAQAKNRVGLFITDHVRMVRPDNSRAEERERLEQCYQDHKSMAKRLGVPWILLAHTTRTDVSNVRTAKDIRRPTMHSLYGSSAAENTADAVIFVHRPSVILADVRPTEGAKHFEEWQIDMEKWEGKAELLLGKHRSRKGRGIRTIHFAENCTWFT